MARRGAHQVRAAIRNILHCSEHDWSLLQRETCAALRILTPRNHCAFHRRKIWRDPCSQTGRICGYFGEYVHRLATSPPRVPSVVCVELRPEHSDHVQICGALCKHCQRWQAHALPGQLPLRTEFGRKSHAKVVSQSDSLRSSLPFPQNVE